MRFAAFSMLLISSLLSARLAAGAEAISDENADSKQRLPEDDVQTDELIGSVTNRQVDSMSEAELLAFFLEASDEELNFSLSKKMSQLPVRGGFNE